MKHYRGFTFVEVVIGIALFLIFVVAAYQSYAAIYAAIASSHHKTLAADLANAQFEIMKNLPYSRVGITGGNPNGVIPASQTVIRDRVEFTVNTTIQNIDDPFDGISGSGDAFPADYKLVEVSISCQSCKNFNPVVITGRIAPKNLESA